MAGRETFLSFLFMKKSISFGVLSLLVFLALIPPIDFAISNPTNSLWFVMVLICGFLGIFTLFMKTDWTVKIVAIWSFILCFYGIQYISFTSYVSIIICCYLYILCRRIENWDLVFNVLQTILFLNMVLIIMQAIGHDELLNFGLGRDIICFGVIGQHMQMGSFSVILSAILLPRTPANLFFPFVVSKFCRSPWAFICAVLGVFLSFKQTWISKIVMILCLILFFGFSIKQEKFSQNFASTGRVHIWKQTLEYALQKPLVGWGPGTYKTMFGIQTETVYHNVPYRSAHNAWFELLYETGIPFTLFIISVIGILVYRLWKARESACIAGLMMIFMDTLVHFPDRMLQTVGLMILFLAYCMSRLDKKFVGSVMQKA